MPICYARSIFVIVPWPKHTTETRSHFINLRIVCRLPPNCKFFYRIYVKHCHWSVKRMMAMRAFKNVYLIIHNT